MGFAVTSKSKPKVLPPAGSHIARCYMVVDLGLQTWTYNNEASEGEKVHIQFELPKKKHVFDERKGPEPFSISEEFIVAFGPNAKLRKFLEAWLGYKLDDKKLKMEGFDFEQLVGKEARLSIQHDVAKSSGNDFAKIGAIMPLDEEDTCPPTINQEVYMWMQPEVFSIRDWLNTYKYLQDKAKLSPDWKKLERLGLTDTDAAYRRPSDRNEDEARPTVRDSPPDQEEDRRQRAGGDTKLRELANRVPDESDDLEF